MIQKMAERKNNNDNECQAFGCYSMGTQDVEMKIDDDKVITIWACERCAKLLR